MSSSGDSTVDLAQARVLLEALFDGLPRLIEIRAINPDIKGSRNTFHATVDAALARIGELGTSGRNVYVGIATRRDASSGTKSNLQSLRAFWVDLDDLTDPAARAASEQKIAAFPLKSSMRIWSGGGLHLYWMLHEPIDVTDTATIERIETILKGLADFLGGDRAATDASRILRVPGTINYPDQKKRSKGRTEARCELIEQTDAEYDLEDFEDFEQRSATLSTKNTGKRSDYQSTRDATLPDYIREFLEIEPDLRARFNRVPGNAQHQFQRDKCGRPDPKKPNQSAIDHSLACMLAHWGIREADIERTLRASHVKAGLPLKSDHYYRWTVDHAVPWTAEREREREQERANV